jgi:hypothetical protein
MRHVGSPGASRAPLLSADPISGAGLGARQALSSRPAGAVREASRLSLGASPPTRPHIQAPERRSREGPPEERPRRHAPRSPPIGSGLEVPQAGYFPSANPARLPREPSVRALTQPSMFVTTSRRSCWPRTARAPSGPYTSSKLTISNGSPTPVLPSRPPLRPRTSTAPRAVRPGSS